MRMNQFRTGPASLIAGMAVSGVVSLVLAQQVVLPPNPSESKKESSSTKESDKPGGDNRPPVIEGLSASVDPNTYKIGAEDVIKVLVWKEPDLSFTASVRPDGRVTAPLVGDIVAAGQTPAALAAELKQKNSEFVINPLVNVEVMQVRSKKYMITGMVQRTGAFSLVVPTTILEALTLAGGLTEWADRKKIVIIRRGGEQRLTFNYEAAIKGKTKKDKNGQTDNVLLENGDLIVVQ